MDSTGLTGVTEGCGRRTDRQGCGGQTDRDVEAAGCEIIDGAPLRTLRVFIDYLEASNSIVAPTAPTELSRGFSLIIQTLHESIT